MEKKSKVHFFRPGVNLEKIVRDGKYLNEVVTVEGKDYITFGTNKWTALKEMPKTTVKKGK